jgi:acyl-CoA thioesterase-1
MSAARRGVLSRAFHCTALAGLAALPWAAQGQSPLLAVASAIPRAPRHTVLVVGDSLSAEYGLPRGSGWVALLEQRLDLERLSARVVNASISGDTTAGGLSRLGALLKQHRPTHVILELGGNDALRGLPLADTQRNLTEMTRAAKAASAKVLIVGIQVPPNYGRRYTDDLAALFVAVAKAEGASLVPSLLDGVGEAEFQADRIHPRASAHPKMAATVWPALKPLLR